MSLRLKRLNVELGRWIGQGIYKSVYLVKGDPTKVVLTTGFISVEEESREDGGLLREVELLEKMRAAGLPTLKVLDVGLLNGGLHLGAITDRYHSSSRQEFNPEKVLDVLSERTLEMLQGLRGQLYDGKYFVSDLQFLFDEQGSLVLADPLNFKPLRTTEQLELMEEAVAKVEAAALFASHLRAGRCSWSPEKSECNVWKLGRKYAQRLGVFPYEFEDLSRRARHVPEKNEVPEFCRICRETH